MGISDRDYYRYDTAGGVRTGFGGMSAWSVTTWLIVLNVGVFVLDALLVGVTGPIVLRYDQIIPISPTHLARVTQRMPMQPLEYWGHFSVATAIFQAQVWRFLSFQFLHAGVLHLLMNMIGLFMFGPLIEQALGARRFLAFYLLCGVAGPIGYMILWGGSNMAPSESLALINEAAIPLVGASAGIFGILIAAAQIAPHAMVLFMGILPMSLRTLAWVLLAGAVYTVFTSGHNAGGEAAHLGGAVLGWILIRNPYWLNVFDRRRRGTRW